MKLAPLFVIEATAFLLIIAETYFFFDFVVPLGPIPHYADRLHRPGAAETGLMPMARSMILPRSWTFSNGLP